MEGWGWESPLYTYLRTLQSSLGNTLDGRGEPRGPASGPYLLGHGGLHHARCVGLQAIVVVVVRVQLQKGPPAGGGEGTLGQRGGKCETGPQLGMHLSAVLNHRKQRSDELPFT